jgi:ATP-dependent RNA helicase MSS116
MAPGKPAPSRKGHGNRRPGKNHAFKPPRPQQVAPLSIPASPLRPLTPDVPQDTPRFAELEGQNLLDPTILRTLTDDLHFDHMMPVQAATLHLLLEGKDCLAQAKTGTGKTLAFLLPAIQTILKNRTSRLSTLVLCPTRELALQIAAEAQKVLLRLPRCKVATSIGGTNKNVELKRILDGCDILVATPGRLLDHLSEESVQQTLGGLQTLVLDEADRMVDMGFLPDMKRILSYLPKLPRHTMLFSATIDDQLTNVARLFLNSDYEYISTIPEGEANTHERVDQYLVLTPGFVEHAPALISVVNTEFAKSKPFKAIIFAPTAAQADFYGQVLASTDGLPEISVLHSRMSQGRRTKTTTDFRQATNAICVATDVIARGMDFPAVTHVFQVGIPSDRETYIHRLGRTARAGAEGRGILVLSTAEKVFLRQLKEIRVKDYPTEVQYNVQDVQSALAKVDPETKSKVYQAWLGYHKTFMKLLGWSTEELIGEANKFALAGLGCAEVPGLYKRTIGKMGLKGVRGLVVLPNPPGSNDPGRRGGGGGGRLQGRAPGRD